MILKIVSKIKHFYYENRFLIILIAACSIIALILFFYGFKPGNNFAEYCQDIASNVAVEIVGAIIGILFINWLLQKHEEQSLQSVRLHIKQEVLPLAYETVVRSVMRIPQPEYDPIDTLASVELFEMVLRREISSATKTLDNVFPKPFGPVHPIIHGLMEKVTSDLLGEWREFLNRFQSYLTPGQTAGILSVIEQLEQMVSTSLSMKEIMDEINLDRIIASGNKMELDKLAHSKAAENLGLSIRSLCTSVLELLNLLV